MAGLIPLLKANCGGAIHYSKMINYSTIRMMTILLAHQPLRWIDSFGWR